MLLVKLAVPFAAAAVLHCSAVGAQVFTVTQSIEMTQLADPDILYSNFRPLEIKTSPDGEKFFLVTKKGNLKTGTNDYELLLYDMSSVARSLAGDALPPAAVLARFSSSSNRPGIASARWGADGRTIAFLGENPGEVPQIYKVRTDTRMLEKLSSHTTPVLDFDLAANGEDYLYMAEAPVDWSARLARGYVVESESLMETIGKGRRSLYTRAAFYIGTGNAPPRGITSLEPYEMVVPHGISVSPKGRWAIVVQHLRDAPETWWLDYLPLASARMFKEARRSELKGFTADNPAIFVQFALVDMRSGDARIIVDAPSGLIFGGQFLGAHWLADESSFILANTFLPLRDVSPQELARRRACPAIVEVQTATGALRRIVDIASPDDSKSIVGPYMSSTLDVRGDLHVAWKPSWTAPERRTVHRERGGRWLEVKRPELSDTRRLSLRISQDLDVPPDILATDPVSGRSKVVTDLNPQFRDIHLGHSQVLEWRDRKNRVWRGSLLKPPSPMTAARYPLVIQAGRFTPSAFWVDGPPGVASGYAARALAGRGIVVLQMGNETSGGQLSGFRDELESVVAGYESAITELDSIGLIDARRVGIHGFSRTGFYVQHALIFSNVRFAAASVSDPSALGIWSYLKFFGNGYPGMIEYERMIGAPLWGDENVKVWIERDPTFHLHRLRTPLRIEEYGGDASWWDTYVILRRHRRPVEYVEIPDGAHGLIKPWERLTSQALTVDWYDFWLNAHEDPDPEKRGQYARWRKLRTLQEAETSNSHSTQ